MCTYSRLRLKHETYYYLFAKHSDSVCVGVCVFKKTMLFAWRKGLQINTGFIDEISLRYKMREGEKYW